MPPNHPMLITDPEEIELIRATVTRRVGETSLREVARNVGMSPSGLQKFTNGARPYAKTFLRLRTWYVRELAENRSAVTPQDVHSALLVLTQGLDASTRRDVALATLEQLAGAFSPHRPPWLDALTQTWQNSTATAHQGQPMVQI